MSYGVEMAALGRSCSQWPDLMFSWLGIGSVRLSYFAAYCAAKKCQSYAVRWGGGCLLGRFPKEQDRDVMGSGL